MTAVMARPAPIARSSAGPQAAEAPYAVVHLVAQESGKPLIGPQVLDHMQWQAVAPGANSPRRVVVGLIEAARVATSPATGRRARELQKRAPGVRVAVLPYVSRFSAAANAPFLAARLKQLIGDLPVVFHCRGESAVEWAVALRPSFARGGIVADIRGPWPEELLFARGFDGPARADPRSLRDYHVNLGRLHDGLAHAGAVISVSAGMLDWLEGLGVGRDRMAYVPCCVPRVTYTSVARERTRTRLALGTKLVFTYLGIVTRYQHVQGGVVPFMREAARQLGDDVHLLVLTPDVAAVRGMLEEGGVTARHYTALHVPQDEVAEHLAAGDAGLLLRESSRLTRVVQPVKLGEYLAAGLPVVVSRGAGTVDSLVEDAGAGVVVALEGQACDDVPGEVSRTCAILREQGDRMRDAALALCERDFLWSRYTNVVRDAYRHALAWQS